MSPPFWGCCKSSACTDGCSTKDLAGAYLSGNPSDSAPFAALNDSFVDTSSKTSTSATLSSTSAGPTASSTGAGSLEVTSSSHGSSNNTGAIAGGVVGGLAILAALIFGMTWLLRRRRKAAAEQQHNVQQPEAATYAAPGMAKQDMNGVSKSCSLTRRFNADCTSRLLLPAAKPATAVLNAATTVLTVLAANTASALLARPPKLHLRAARHDAFLARASQHSCRTRDGPPAEFSTLGESSGRAVREREEMTVKLRARLSCHMIRRPSDKFSSKIDLLVRYKLLQIVRSLY